MKKYSKIFAFAFAFLVFLLASNSVFAREMTKDTLGAEALKLNPGKEINYVYVIGHYAFTQAHSLTQEDIMLAARSIDAKPEDGYTKDTNLYKKMNIQMIEPVYDDDWKVTSWQNSNNTVGTTKLGEKFDIRYIDYNFIYEEVNTDELLEKSVGEIVSKDYGATFANKTLTYNVYDKNEKSSNAILLGTIRDILNTENVKEVTISYGGTKVTFNSSDMTNDEAGATTKVQDLLKKVSGKETGEILQGDLVGKKLSLTITLDGEKAKSQNNKESEEYSIEFAYNEKATIDAQIPEKDINDLKENFKYTPETTYSITKTADGLYTVDEKSYVTKQDGVKGFGENPKGYYFAYTLTLNNEVDLSKATVKIPKSSNPEDGYNEGTFDSETRKLTVLMEVEENEETKYRDIIIEVEGVSTVVRIDFSKLELRTISKFNVEDAKNEEKLQQAYGWKMPENYGVNYAADGEKVKVTGLLPIYKGDNTKIPFDEGHKTGYYIAFAIKTNTNSGETTTVDITDGSEKMTWGKSNFDNDNTIYILKHLHKDAEEKTFTIKVDMDGEGTDTYEPYTITVDWSELHLQQESSMTEVSAITDTKDLTDVDKDQITTQWGYSFENAGKDLAIKKESDTYTLTGKVKEQTVKEEAGFDTEKGYYIVLKINGPTTDNLSSTPYVATDKWTVQLKDANGSYKTAYKPSTEDYGKGFVTALIKLNKDAEDKKITYKIDWDGEGNDYLPYEETIDYTTLEYLASHTITLNGETKEKITVWDEDVVTTRMLPDPTVKEEEKDYRSFAYWDKGDGTKYENETISGDTGDITLVPHWNLYSDKFISDVLNDLNKTEDSKSEDFSKEFVIGEYKENTGEVKITVIDPTTLLSRMNDTSIPGTIAYILLKDEIKGITLSINGEEKTFTKGDASDKDTLKATIIDEAQKFYSEILKKQFADKDEKTITLSDIAHKTNYDSFILKFDPSQVSKTVTLTKAPAQEGISRVSVVDVPTSYKFIFESHAIIVKSEADLNSALSSQATKIFIGDNFTVKNTVNITRGVTIEGNSKYTITAESEDKSIFDVTSSGVTINNIKLTGAKTPITVTSGELTSKGLTVEGASTESAFEVKNGAKLTVSELTYDGEHYNKPAVKAEKENTTVKFTDSASKDAVKLETLEKIIHYEEQEEEKSIMGDKKETVADNKYNNYYNKEENSKVYEIIFHNHEGRRIAEFVRYYYYNEDIKEPSNEDRFVALGGGFKYDGYDYTKIGYTESGYKTVFFDNTEDGVIKDLGKATSNKYYFVAFKATLDSNVKHVTDADGLYNALTDSTTNEIYIENDIDFSDKGPITINKELSIIGPPKTIKLQVADGIKITADDVFIHRINLEVTAKEGDKALIDVTTSNNTEKTFKFILWQSTLKNVGVPVESAIKLDGTDKVATDIRWNTFRKDNITNTYIDIQDALAGVSEICSNTFEKITSNDKKISDITIISFDKSAKMTDTDEPIRMEYNTFNNDYAVKILKDASGKEADILLSTSRNITIAVECTTSEDFSGIKFHTKDYKNITRKYIVSGEEKDKPEGVKEFSIVVGAEIITENPES